MYKLPLFPLNVVLFPGMPIDLHIFEPRYRLMMSECIEQEHPFGVALIREGVEAGGPPALPYPVGCTARVAQVERLEDGRMNLTAIGEERFRIMDLDFDRPYLVAQVETFPLENPHPLEVLRGIRPLQEQITGYLHRLSSATHDEMDLSQMELPEDAQGLLYLAGALLQIPLVEKQPLLEAPHTEALLDLLGRLYRREISLLLRGPSEVDEEKAKRLAWLN